MQQKPSSLFLNIENHDRKSYCFPLLAWHRFSHNTAGPLPPTSTEKRPPICIPPRQQPTRRFGICYLPNKPASISWKPLFCLSHDLIFGGKMVSPAIPAGVLYLSVACCLGSRLQSADCDWSSQQRWAGRTVRCTIFGSDISLSLVDFWWTWASTSDICNKWDFPPVAVVDLGVTFVGVQRVLFSD